MVPLYDLMSFGDSFIRQGYPRKSLRKFLEPATSYSVAHRMAGNLANASIRSNSRLAPDNTAYWSTIRRFLEKIQQQKEKHAS